MKEKNCRQWLAIGKRLTHGVLRPIYGTRMLFFFSLLMAIVIMLAGNMVDDRTNPFLTILLSVFDCYLLSALAGVLKRIKLHFLVAIPVILILFAELFTELFYHSNFTVYVVLLLFETNPKESSEFVQAVLPHAGTWIAVVLTLMVGGLAWFLARCTRKAFKYKELVIFLAFAVIVWSGIRQLSAYVKLYRCFVGASTTVCNDPRNCPHLETPFVRLLYGVAYNMASTAELDVLAESVKNTKVDSCTYRCPLLVLVIGESYNKHHSTLYGYSLPTTPRLQQLCDEGLLTVYEDAVAPFNFTSNAFKYMFSTWDADDEEEWTQHTLFPALFKKAGYQVFFITNQFTSEQTDIWDQMGGTIFNHQGLSDEQFTKRNAKPYPYDGELLSEIPSLDILTAKPTLLIVHLIGQHVNYENKYPKEFARFKPEDEKTNYGGQEGKETAAHYDNAVYYNDYVVDSIFRMVSDVDALAIYLSDHGEEVYDWRDQFERTNEAAIVPQVAHYQYEIPLMFYTTNSFTVHHANVVEAVKTSRRKPFYTGDLPHLLLYLGGIGSKEYQERLNILSPGYDTKRKRIIRNDVDYDELMKSE